jgi:putative transposase
MDEMYINVNGACRYLYRAVDKQCQTVGFLLTTNSYAAAAKRFFESALLHNTVSNMVTMDKSGGNQAALEQLNKERQVPIEIRQVIYLNNIVEQDHRAIKRITRPILGFKWFQAARAIPAGIELMHMLRKGQFRLAGEDRRLPTSFTH